MESPLHPVLRFLGVVALGCVVAWGPSLPAQSSELDREVAFVRQLAERMRFYSLAQQEVGRLRKAYRREPESRRLALLGIRVSVLRASVDLEPESRRWLLRHAVQSCRRLIDRDPQGAIALEGRATLARACEELGRSLNDELVRARAGDPDAVGKLEAEAATVFGIGVEACEKVMAALRSRRDEPGVESDYQRMWARKGVLLREHGRAVKAERRALCSRARETLEEYLLECGCDDTALSLRAFFEYARCEELLGAVDDAIVMYEDLIEQIATALKEASDLGLDAETRQFLSALVQEVAAARSAALSRAGRRK